MEVNPILLKEFKRFCESVSVPFFNRSMRFVVFEFLKTDVGRDDLYTPNFLNNVNALYRLLDLIEDEHHRQKPPALRGTRMGVHSREQLTGKNISKKKNKL